MPFREVSRMDECREFVMLADLEGVNFRGLCRRFGVSPMTGYKWLERWRREGAAGLRERSRRPLTSPSRSCAAVEEAVLALRAEHPAWGGRKLSRRLKDLGHEAVPAPSTITATKYAPPMPITKNNSVKIGVTIIAPTTRGSTRY